MADIKEVRQKAGLALSRDLFCSLSRKRRKMYRHWKRAEEIHAAKAQLEMKLATTVGDNIKGFLKDVNSKRKSRDNIGLLLSKDGCLTNRNTDKTVAFNAFFASVFYTDWDPRSTVPAGTMNSQQTPK